MPKQSPHFLHLKVKVSIFFLFCSLFSFAQQKITVHGKVITGKDIPLAGLSVNIKGTTTGTTTDAEGRFSLDVDNGGTLVLSFVGYEGKEVVVNGENDVRNIEMVSTASGLGEVVVIGYGTQLRRNVTGAIS